MKPLKILVFAEYGCRNGGENSFLAVAQRLKKDSINFVVACPQTTELSRFLDEIDVPTVPWNVRDDCNIRKTHLQIRAEIAALIHNEKPDVVHANSLSTCRLVGPVAAEVGIPSVGYLRDIVKLSKKAVEDINQLSAIIAVSSATRDFHLGQGISSQKSLVIYNGVDLDQFRPDVPTGCLHRELRLTTEMRIIICVGQIGMRKGTDIVLRSFSKLCERHDDIALIMVGIRNSEKREAIDFESDCKRLCQTHEKINPIFWLGRRNDVANIMNESTLLLHGARQEPLGRVLLEAMASGLPFVATDVGGTQEIVTGVDIDKVICKPDSVADMVKNADEFLNSATFRNSTSTKFRSISKKNFDIEICANHLKLKYWDLVANASK